MHGNGSFFGEYMKIQENRKIKEALNEKILDSILDDDDEKFIQLVSQIKGTGMNSNKKFKMTQYNIPYLLEYHPTYASLCTLFSAEKCFTSLLNLCSNEQTSENFKRPDKKGRSPIHFACIGGNLNIIRQLYQLGFDLNAADDEGFHPSHYSAMSGTIDVMKYLWMKGAINLTNQGKETTPLCVACLYGSLNIVKFFFETVDLKNEIVSMKEVFYENKKTTIFHLACEGGHADILDYLLTIKEYAKKQVNKLDHKSRTPLNVACQNGSLSCVKLLINVGKVNINGTSKKHIALIDAVEGGHSDIVSFLLQQGVDINIENSNNMTAIEVAIMNCHLNITKILVQNGTTKNWDEQKIGNLFLLACGGYDIKIIRYLDEIFDIPYQSMGDMFVKQACRIENEELISFLMEKNCSLNCLDADDFSLKAGWNPFMTFMHKKGLDFSQIYLESGQPMIVNSMKRKCLQTARDLIISEGKVFGVEMINAYDLINLACKEGELNLFLFLMKFKPLIKNSTVYLKNLIKEMRSSTVYINSIRLEEYFEIAEYLLRDYNANPSDKELLSDLAYRMDFKLLELLGKYGADFNNIIFISPEMLSKKYVKVIDYMIKKGVNINNIYAECNYYMYFYINKVQLIVDAFMNCKSEMVEELLKRGAIITTEMIEKHRIYKEVCTNGKADLLIKLLKYKPKIKNIESNLFNLIKSFDKLTKELQESQKEDFLNAIEIIVKDYNFNCNNEMFIHYFAEKCLIDFLKLFQKYGADFSNCSLDYEEMITKEHLAVFHFLEQNGCLFNRHKKMCNIIVTYYPTKEIIEPPIKVNFAQMLSCSYDIGTLLFLIKYSSNKDLIELRTNQIVIYYNGTFCKQPTLGNQNIVDILLITGQFKSLFDLYQKLNCVVFPLAVPMDNYKSVIFSCDVQELKDMISNIH